MWLRHSSLHWSLQSPSWTTFDDTETIPRNRLQVLLEGGMCSAGSRSRSRSRSYDNGKGANVPNRIPIPNLSTHNANSVYAASTDQ